MLIKSTNFNPNNKIFNGKQSGNKDKDNHTNSLAKEQRQRYVTPDRKDSSKSSIYSFNQQVKTDNKIKLTFKNSTPTHLNNNKLSYNNHLFRLNSIREDEIKRQVSNHNSYLPYMVKYSYRNNDKLNLDNDSFQSFIEKKKDELDPSKKLGANLPAKKEVPKKKVYPLFYINLRSNRLSEVNFQILNIWFLNYGENYNRFQSVSLRDRYHMVKQIINADETMLREVRPIFQSLDMDDSGYIDFKEYKMTRFLLDGVIKKAQLRNEFKQIDSQNKGVIGYQDFLELYRTFFRDSLSIMEYELYNITNGK